MTPETVARLLELNRSFYAAIGPIFDLTRHGIPQGMERALTFVPASGVGVLRVLDAGCGNGRLARALEELGRPVEYVGVDADALLLAAAQGQTAGLAHVETSFVQANLAEPGWRDALEERRFDVVFCLATLHHFPGTQLRRRILNDLFDCAPDGVTVLSTWQFWNSPRLLGRIQPWSSVGLAPEDVEAGDVILPWDQGVHALRYVHAIGLDELSDVADARGLALRAQYEADGAEGNLNLYVIFGPMAPDVSQ